MATHQPLKWKKGRGPSGRGVNGWLCLSCYGAIAQRPRLSLTQFS
jgi:hypothetical protein